MRFNRFLVFMVFAVFVCVLTVGDVSAAGNNSTDNTAIYKNTTGQSQYTGPQTNTTKWINNSIQGTGTAAQVAFAKNGTIYIQGGSALYAFNPDGTLLWSYPTSSGSTTRSAPVVGNDGTIYAFNYGTLYAVNPNGTQEWAYNFGSQAVGSPVLDSNGIIYFTTSLGRVYAIDTTLSDPSKADPKWMNFVDVTVNEGVALSPDSKTLYFATTNGRIYALNTAYGSLKWNYTTVCKSNLGTPVVDSNGIIYVAGASSHMLYAIIDSGNQATVKWNTTIQLVSRSTVAIGSNGVIYIAMSALTNNFYALNSDGSVLYITNTTSGSQLTQPVIGSDGTVYIGTISGSVYAFNPDLTLKWKYTPTSTTTFSRPMIGPDGTLYIGTNNNVFYAFQDLIGNFTSTGSGLDVGFTDTSTNIPTSWSWDFGDGVTSDLQNPMHTYSAPGKYNVTLTVTIGSGESNTVVKEITVNLAPTLDTIGNKTVDENKSISFPVVGHDTPGDTLTYSATGLPAGTTLNPNTGAFSWIPSYSQAGTYHITFTVSDGSLTASETITITVNNVNRAPVLGFAGITVNENQHLNFNLGGSDEDGDTLTYSATGLPSGATFNSATGVFSWTPSFSQAGTYHITFNVFDGSVTVSKIINIVVNDVDNVAPKVTKVDPVKNAVIKVNKKAINVTFDEAVKNGSLWAELKNSSGVPLKVTTKIVGKVLTIAPASVLANGKYTLTLNAGAFNDLVGNGMAAYYTVFSVDTVAPTVKSIGPKNGATKVSASKALKIVFNEAIKAGKMSLVTLKNSSGKAVKFKYKISGSTLIITPNSKLAESLYTLTISKGAVTDKAGNQVATKKSKFGVGKAPTVTKVDPKNGATKVSRSKTIKVTFNEAIKKGTYKIVLKDSKGKTVKVTASISGKVLSIKHAKLATNTKYKLYIYAGAITDKAGNPVAAKTYTFTTGKT